MMNNYNFSHSNYCLYDCNYSLFFWQKQGDSMISGVQSIANLLGTTQLMRDAGGGVSLP